MRSALKRVGVALAGALLASSVVVAPAHAEPASLSGTVTAADTGQPTAVCVTVWDTSYGWAGGTCSESGSWSVDGLEAGTAYKVEFQATDRLLGEWADDARTFDAARDVTAPAAVNAQLEVGAVLSGTLLRGDGRWADETGVTAWASGSDEVGGRGWVRDGTWRALVPEGDYEVQFVGNGYDQWAYGSASRDGATTIHASAGATTTVDDVLTQQPTESFSGVVTSASTGEPVDACVTAYVAATYEYADSVCTPGDTTGVPGHWAMFGLQTGVEYKLFAQTWDGSYLQEWVNDAASFETASPVVFPGTVDIALDTPAFIGGTLLDTAGAPVPDASVGIWSSDQSDYVSAMTDESGHWRAGLRSGDYIVAYYVGGRVQYAVGAEDAGHATVYTLRSGETVDASDRMLAQAQVRGTVTSTSGAPVAGACVDIIRMPVVDWPEQAGQACTDGDGHYTADLWGDGGTFTARFSDPEGRFVQEYYEDHLTLADADTFSATRGEPVVVDASLDPGAKITGLAVDAKLGTPLAGACPDAYVGHAGGQVEGAVATCSDATGRWTIAGLPAGSFALHLGMGQGPYPSGDVWAFKGDSQATADLVTVKAGVTTSIRNVKIDTPVTISGRITDPSGNPVEGATVNPRGQLMDRSGECFDCATTDADGRYTVGPLAAGTYRPVAYADYGQDLAPQWSGHSSTFEGATPITIKAGKSASFSAQLVPASTIEGELVNADGSPAGEGWIGFVETPTGVHMGDFDVFGGNTFSPVTLPAGEFVVHLQNAYTGQEAWYDGASTAAAATRVTLGEGEHRTLTIHLP